MKFKTLLFLLFYVLSCTVVFSQNDVFDIARNGTLEEIKKINTASPGAINSKNADGYIPLILACYKGNVDVVKFLVKNSNTINIPSGMGTALMAATYKGQTDIVKILLENKANPNLSDADGMTPLMYATISANKNIIKLLLDYKADKLLTNKDGKTAFEFAVFSGNQDIIQQLKN
jgi:uncharacterized protein